MKCIVDISNYTLKMANTDNYPGIINDNWEMTCPLNKLYSLCEMVLCRFSLVIGSLMIIIHDISGWLPAFEMSQACQYYV